MRTTPDSDRKDAQLQPQNTYAPVVFDVVRGMLSGTTDQPQASATSDHPSPQPITEQAAEVLNEVFDRATPGIRTRFKARFDAALAIK